MCKITIGIYKIANTKNNKCYIGQSIDIEKRFKEHIYHLENNKHHSVKLQRSYNMTKDKSVFQFEIIEETTKELLNEREEYYIKHFDSFYNGYNCSQGSTNHKYVESKNKLKTQEYKRFMELHNTYGNILQIGKLFLNKLTRKYYKYRTYKIINEVIFWFINNYDYKKYVGKIDIIDKKYFLLVGDNEQELKFACYYWKNNQMIISQDDTKVYLEMFKRECNYDKNKHYIVGDFKEQ